MADEATAVADTYGEIRALADQLAAADSREDLAVLLVSLAVLTSAGPVGWVTMAGAALWATFREGTDTTGAVVYWPQDTVPDDWQCQTGATWRDERAGVPSDGYRCRARYLDPLPARLPSDLPDVPRLTAADIAEQVGAAIRHGRPGVPSEKRRAAVWARALIGAGALTGPAGQTIGLIPPSTVREVWSQAQRGTSGAFRGRVLAYLYQMLTRVDEWAPLLGWVLVDPALLVGLDGYLPATLADERRAAQLRQQARGGLLSGLSVSAGQVTAPAPAVDRVTPPATDSEPDSDPTGDSAPDPAAPGGGGLLALLALVGLALAAS